LVDEVNAMSRKQRVKQLAIEQLPVDLVRVLRQLSSGDEVTILDERGRPLALLQRHPQRPLSAKAAAAQRAKVEQRVREMALDMIAHGLKVTPDHPFWEYTGEGRSDAA
jgi:antitoxin (DNA-binding transcriptional repressor) of toxin-antitoxin stability system